MTSFFSNRDIYESAICGLVPQMMELQFKLCASGECLDGWDDEVALKRCWH